MEDYIFSEVINEEHMSYVVKQLGTFQNSYEFTQSPATSIYVKGVHIYSPSGTFENKTQLYLPSLERIPFSINHIGDKPLAELVCIDNNSMTVAFAEHKIEFVYNNLDDETTIKKFDISKLTPNALDLFDRRSSPLELISLQYNTNNWGKTEFNIKVKTSDFSYNVRFDQ